MSDKSQNSIYAVTPAKKMTQEEITNTFAPDPEDEEGEENQTLLAIEQPKPEDSLHIDFPEDGSIAKRRKMPKGQRFTDTHATVSLTVDKTIYADVQAYLDAGGVKYGNRTVFANRLFKKLLKESGWPGY